MRLWFVMMGKQCKKGNGSKFIHPLLDSHGQIQFFAGQTQEQMIQDSSRKELYWHDSNLKIHKVFSLKYKRLDRRKGNYSCHSILKQKIAAIISSRKVQGEKKQNKRHLFLILDIRAGTVSFTKPAQIHRITQAGRDFRRFHVQTPEQASGQGFLNSCLENLQEWTLHHLSG